MQPTQFQAMLFNHISEINNMVLPATVILMACWFIWHKSDFPDSVKRLSFWIGLNFLIVPLIAVLANAWIIVLELVFDVHGYVC